MDNLDYHKDREMFNYVLRSFNPVESARDYFELFMAGSLTSDDIWGIMSGFGSRDIISSRNLIEGLEGSLNGGGGKLLGWLLGFIYHASRRYSDSINSFAKTAGTDHVGLESLYSIGLCYEKRLDFIKSLGCFTEARNVVWKINFQNRYEDLSTFDAQSRLYATVACNLERRVLEKMAKLQYRTGKLGDLVGTLSTLESEFGPSSTIYFLRGKIFYLKENYSEAYDNFRRLFVLNESNFESEELILISMCAVLCLVELGRFEDIDLVRNKLSKEHKKSYIYRVVIAYVNAVRKCKIDSLLNDIVEEEDLVKASEDLFKYFYRLDDGIMAKSVLAKMQARWPNNKDFLLEGALLGEKLGDEVWLSNQFAKIGRVGIVKQKEKDAIVDLALRTKNYDFADIFIHDLLCNEPDKFLYRYYEIAYFRLICDFGSALNSCIETLKRFPRHYDIRLIKVKLHKMRKEYIQAERELISIIHDDPHRIEARLLLVEVMMDQGEFLRALNLCKEIETLWPGRDDVLGLILLCERNIKFNY